MTAAAVVAVTAVAGGCRGSGAPVHRVAPTPDATLSSPPCAHTYIGFDDAAEHGLVRVDPDPESVERTVVVPRRRT